MIPKSSNNSEPRKKGQKGDREPAREEIAAAIQPAASFDG